MILTPSFPNPRCSLPLHRVSQPTTELIESSTSEDVDSPTPRWLDNDGPVQESLYTVPKSNVQRSRPRCIPFPNSTFITPYYFLFIALEVHALSTDTNLYHVCLCTSPGSRTNHLNTASPQPATPIMTFAYHPFHDPCNFTNTHPLPQIHPPTQPQPTSLNHRHSPNQHTKSPSQSPTSTLNHHHSPNQHH